MSEDEILGKIELEHQNGQHLTGPQAGCRLCEEAKSPPLGASTFRKVLQETIESEGGNLSDAEDVPPRHAPEDVVRSMYGDPIERDELSFGDAAVDAAQRAREQLQELNDRGIVVPNERAALVHGSVGMVYAILAVDDALRAVLAAFEPVLPDDAMWEGDLHSNAGVRDDGEAPGTPEGQHDFRMNTDGVRYCTRCGYSEASVTPTTACSGEQGVFGPHIHPHEDPPDKAA